MLSVYIGTFAFTHAGWEGSFYPEGTKPADFLRQQTQHFNRVEVDSTFYRIPTEAAVQGWGTKTPDGIRFAAKVPQIITHEKVLARANEFPFAIRTHACRGVGILHFQLALIAHAKEDAPLRAHACPLARPPSPGPALPEHLQWGNCLSP